MVCTPDAGGCEGIKISAAPSEESGGTDFTQLANQAFCSHQKLAYDNIVQLILIFSPYHCYSYGFNN